MRYLIGVVAICLSSQAFVGAQSSGTASELADDQLGGALWRIAAATQTRIGFESVEFVRLPVRLKNIPAFPISSRDEALNAAVEANPGYEWRAVGDVAVVRPKNAWHDSANPFNRPVRNLRVENASDVGAIHGLRDFIYTNGTTITFPVAPDPGIPVTFDLRDGTVVDALNQLMVSAGTVMWNASYRPDTRGRRVPNWDLQIQLRDSMTLRTESDSHPLRGQK
jgi:hypothetical protein